MSIVAGASSHLFLVLWTVAFPATYVRQRYGEWKVYPNSKNPSWYGFILPRALLLLVAGGLAICLDGLGDRFLAVIVIVLATALTYLETKLLRSA